jgi:hypothetical protein
MTGIVLALAGLTAGGGGVSIGAASSPVCISLDGEWEGTWQSASFGTRKTRLRWGGGLWPAPEMNEWMAFSHSPAPGRTGALEAYGPALDWVDGTFRLTGDQLLIYLRHGGDSVDALTLRRAAPRKRQPAGHINGRKFVILRANAR